MGYQRAVRKMHLLMRKRACVRLLSRALSIRIARFGRGSTASFLRLPMSPRPMAEHCPFARYGAVVARSHFSTLCNVRFLFFCFPEG